MAKRMTKSPMAMMTARLSARAEPAVPDAGGAATRAVTDHHGLSIKERSSVCPMHQRVANLHKPKSHYPILTTCSSKHAYLRLVFVC